MSASAPNPWRIGPVQLPPPSNALPDGIVIDVDGESVQPDNDGKIELPDGSAIVFPFGKAKPSKVTKNNFYDNLIEDIDGTELSRISDELVTGIEADIAGIAERLDDLAQGIEMLGFKLEAPRSDAQAGAATEGMSRFYHPLLQEAVLRFQANARGELFPVEGPVKVEATGADQGEGGDELAQALEDAINRFFTVTASEYYPDSIRMLFDVGLMGSGFKKCYQCPIRRRPVSESIAAEHFIVSNATRDLRTCGRKTHIISMDATTLRRMQILGVYRDIELSDPMGVTANPVSLAQNESAGVNPNTAKPKDRDRTLYETYAELDIEGFEDKDKKGEPTGLRLPYRITIDKDSKEILEIRPNWAKDDPMKLERRVFVKYPYVNAMSFYGIGLFHILGNMTRALTAGSRLSLDNGMLANFPAGLIDSRAARQLTNDFRLGPGGMGKIDVPSGMSIQQVVGQLPYRDVSAPFVSFLESLENMGQRTGGTAELSIGEGKQDAPVGTTLALLEQATKVSDAVHKGLHTAQAEEFQIMKELLQDDPEALWRHDPNETDTWDKPKILEALNRCDIVPRADPNTPSHMHRVMKVQALVQMAQTSPQLFGQAGLKEVATVAIETLGFEDAERFLQPDPQQAGPNPADIAKLITAQNGQQANVLKAQDMQLKKQLSDQDVANDEAERQEDKQVAYTKMATEKIIHDRQLQHEAVQAANDQNHQRTMKAMDIHSNFAAQNAQQTHDLGKHMTDVHADAAKTMLGHVSDHIKQANDHKMQGTLAAMKPKTDGKK